MRLLKSFHIDLGFSLRGGARRELRSSETFRTATPDEIRLIAALEDGQEEFYPDFKSQKMRDTYLKDPEGFERSLRGRLAGH